MASEKQNLSQHNPERYSFVEELAFGVVLSDWNAEITHSLLKGCTDFLKQAGARDEKIKVVHVPGAFELPVAARWLLSHHKLDAVICLGCVIKGETRHDDYINQAVASGLMQLGLITEKPVIFGVLTTEDEQQALDRAGGKHGNKGIEAASTALEMVALSRNISNENRRIGF